MAKAPIVEIGLPPKVLKCKAFFILSPISLEVITAAIGKPLPKDLAAVIISGVTP